MIDLAVVITSTLKSVQRVRSHLREGHSVRGYLRRGKEAARRLFERHYSAIENWAWRSIRHQQRFGVHFGAEDDAYQAAMEASLIALRHYSPAKGPLENYLRRAIKYALLKHIAEERARGFTGVRTLYDRLRMATTEEAREKIVNGFPRVEEIQGTEPTPSIEEMIEGSRVLLKRDEFIGDIEREFGRSLRRVREYLARKEKEKRTWKRTRLAERKLRVFRLRVMEGMSFREISNRLGIDVSQAHGNYQEIAKLVREAHEKIRSVRKALGEAERFRQWRLWRLLFGLERLRITIREGFPPQHIKFGHDVLAGILADLTDDQKPASSRTFTEN